MIAYKIITINCPNVHFDLVSALLLNYGCDSFSEESNRLKAYIEAQLLDIDSLDELIARMKNDFEITYQIEDLEEKNWNEEWEKNFIPVIVDNRCIVKATFHNSEQKYDYEILINPKMSFGTGHHETTYMMIEHILDMDLVGKDVLDAGCGTGILAILAAQMQAKNIVAYDIEDWAYHNAVENILLNHTSHIHVLQGTISTLQLPIPAYDIILANINKNVLLEEISVYYQFLKPNGLLVLSGFFENDISDINNKALVSNYIQQKINVKNNWASVICTKN